MKFVLLIVTCSFINLSLHAQKADVEYIRSSVEIRFNMDLDTLDLCDSYILNGVPYDVDGFSSKIQTFEKSEVKLTAIANIKNSTFLHQNCSYLIFAMAGQFDQSKKEKLKELDSIKSNLNQNLPEVVIRDYICKQCSQVVVDGVSIEMFKSRELVNKLKVKNIDYIISHESANPSVFGRNAINGLTEIFLKKK